MFWSDEGYLLSKKNYNENSLIIDVLTLNHGKCTGMVYGGSSRRMKKFLQIGNKIFLNSRLKNENKLAYFQTELIKPISPIFFDDKKKISCILSASSILNILLPEHQINKKIFLSFENLMLSLYENVWVSNYIFWEQLLVKELGFDFNLFKYANNESGNKKIEINGISFKIPEIFHLNMNAKFTNKQIKEALDFNKNLLVLNFLDGKNFRLPKSRHILESYYN